MFFAITFVGIAFVLVLIAGLFYNWKIRHASQNASWGSNIRQFQNNQLNEGWRIQMIPYDDPNKPETMNMSGVLPVMSVIGVLGFFIGIGMVTYNIKRFQKTGLVISVMSFLLALCCIFLKKRQEQQERHGWGIVNGICVDRELRKILIPPAGDSPGGSLEWVWRIICEYEQLGVRYRVTPEINWTGLYSEKEALKFLEERILPDGRCTLRINLENPLQTMLSDQDAGENKLLC